MSLTKGKVMSEELPLFEWLDEEDRNDSGYTLYNLSNREAFALKDTIEQLSKERDELVECLDRIATYASIPWDDINELLAKYREGEQ